MEVRKLEIDFDEQILRINGTDFLENAIVVTLPGPEGWPLSMLLNSEKLAPEKCAKLTVLFEEF